MDQLTAFVTVARRRLLLRRFLMAIERDPGLLENIEMTPKLQGLASAMAKLKHDVEFEADKLIARVEDAGQASKAAFAKSHKVLDETKRDVAEIEEFIASMAGSNGGPSGPLDDSSDSSDVQSTTASSLPKVEPQDSQVVTEADVGSVDGVLAEPERLTVNGVSAG